MRFDEIVTHVRDNGGPADREHAERALAAVVEVLGERLAGQEPSNLAGQLPAELKHPLTQHSDGGRRFGAEEFLRRVAELEGGGDGGENVRQHVRAVFAALSAAVTGGEFRDVLEQLPSDYEQLLPASR